MRLEIPFTGKVIWQSDTARSFYCGFCDLWLRTQYEGEGVGILLECGGRFGKHVIEIREAPANDNA